MRRRTFVSTLGAAGVALVGAPALLGARRAPYDLVLRGGVIIDGTGRPRFRGDLAVSGDRIARVARRIRETGRREIDCRNHIVAPGFVDIHSHGDGSMTLDPLMESVARQGITSIVVGADGSSRAPNVAEALEAPPTIGAWLASLEVVRPAVNVGTCVGLGTVREVVIGEADRPASDAELARMVALVEQALRDGALGASSGLEYTPGAFASVAELTALCRPLAARGLA